MKNEDDFDYSYMYYEQEPIGLTVILKEKQPKPYLSPYQKMLRKLYKKSSTHRRVSTRR
jgi:hypothetical protein